MGSELVMQGIKYDEFYNAPPQMEIKNFYNSLDVFVSPSRLEGFYLPGLEAMACEIPVVATDSGGNRDYAINGQTALLSPPGIPELLAENIIRVIEDKCLTNALRVNALEMASRFTWKRAIRNILRLFVESESFIRVSDPKLTGFLVEEIIQTKQELRQKDEQIRQKDKYIKAMFNSWSWKITTPLRWIRSLLTKRLKR